MGGARMEAEGLPEAVSYTHLDVYKRQLLWNACPFHPHPSGRPAANRAPTAAEVAAGEWAVRELLTLFPVGQVIAVGNKARAALGRWGIPAAAVRHPSHGGKAAFSRELERLFKKNGTTDFTDGREEICVICGFSTAPAR